METEKPFNKQKSIQDQKNLIASRYPAFKGLVNGNTEDMAALVQEFGQDLVDLLLAVVADGGKKPEQRQFDFTSQAGLDAWDAKVASTAYYTSTTKAQREFDLQAEEDKKSTVDEFTNNLISSYGDVKLSPEKWKEIATNALKKGYKINSAGLGYYINSELDKTPDAVDGSKTALDTGSEVSRLERIAKNYGYSPPSLPDQIKSILTGTPYNGVVLTEEGFIQEAKSAAIGMYGHLRDRIESGSSLEDIFSSYRNRIAQTLELDPKSINLSDPMYSRFLGTPETGQFSLYDVDKTLKTDEKYKYHMTTKANRDSTSLAASLARMFGEIK